LTVIFTLLACVQFSSLAGARSRAISVAIARGKHLFPFRTEPLSPSAPMVLGGQPPGRVGRRRLFSRSRPPGRLRVSRGQSGRVALDRGAEVRPRVHGTGEAPVDSPPSCALGSRPTGAAAGPRQRLPARPARRSGSPVDSLATGPVRGVRRKAILAQRGEVDREIDAAEGPPAEVKTPVGHESQGRRGGGRNIRSAWELARTLTGRAARSCERQAPPPPARSPDPRSTHRRVRPPRRRQPASPSRAPRAARCA
jgi:hypothetical protein